MTRELTCSFIREEVYGINVIAFVWLAFCVPKRACSMFASIDSQVAFSTPFLYSAVLLRSVTRQCYKRPTLLYYSTLGVLLVCYQEVTSITPTSVHPILNFFGIHNPVNLIVLDIFMQYQLHSEFFLCLC